MTVKKEDLIKNGIAALLISLLLFSTVFIGKAWMNGHFSSIDSFRAYLESYGAWGPFVLCLIQILRVMMPILPGFLGCIAGAAMFGAAGGFWANYIGISVGSVAAYWLARHFGLNLVRKMVPMDKFERYTEKTEKISKKKSYTILLFLAILLPLAPDDFFCYFSGLISMSARKFTWIIFLAKPWCILFYSIFFAYLL